MRLEKYIINENNEYQAKLKEVIKKLEDKSFDEIEKILRSNINKFVDISSKDDRLDNKITDILNKHFKINLKNVNDILKLQIKESIDLDEDIKHWWDFIKDQVFPVASFIPALNAWIEIDKMFRSMSIKGGDMKIAIIYTLIWLTMLSSKYVSDWHKWKRENPEQYQKERSAGKGGLI